MIRDSQGDNWLVEQHVTPDAAPIPALLEDHWCRIVADDTFMNLSRSERRRVADRIFRDIEALAQEQGWHSYELQRWFRETAERPERYPILRYSLGTGRTIAYRDLRESGFPKASALKLLMREVFRSEFGIYALLAAPFMFLPYLFVVRTVDAISARGPALRWDVLVGALIVVAVLEGVMMRPLWSQPVALSGYHFLDTDSYVAVSGKWTSNMPLASQEQVTQLECWREWNHCIEATASVYSNGLNVNTTYWQIADWGEGVIVAKDRETACAVTTLIIDRKKEIVVSTRATKKPKPRGCGHVSEGPMVLRLTDGFKLRFRG